MFESDSNRAPHKPRPKLRNMKALCTRTDENKAQTTRTLEEKTKHTHTQRHGGSGKGQQYETTGQSMGGKQEELCVHILKRKKCMKKRKENPTQRNLHNVTIHWSSNHAVKYQVTYINKQHISQQPN